MCPITTNTTERVLTTHDRCDKCRSQAWARATLATGGQLYFCAHHAREVIDDLLPQCLHWLDETRYLQEKPAASAAA